MPYIHVNCTFNKKFYNCKLASINAVSLSVNATEAERDILFNICVIDQINYSRNIILDKQMASHLFNRL